MTTISKQHEKTYKLALAGLMAALCYAGYAFLPAFSADGTKIHFGNTFVVLAAYLLGGWYGGLAGAVGLTVADILGGFDCTELWGAQEAWCYQSNFYIEKYCYEIRYLNEVLVLRTMEELDAEDVKIIREKLELD